MTVLSFAKFDYGKIETKHHQQCCWTRRHCVQENIEEFCDLERVSALGPGANRFALLHLTANDARCKHDHEAHAHLL